MVICKQRIIKNLAKTMKTFEQKSDELNFALVFGSYLII